ncbi:MAG TPA: ABC transporter ATP-binding protein [Bacteroidales bacterium]|nr:MAG: ABC transporter ATP-binding protein [Bacteroidetes bacterium GWF2_33_38]OFY74126.1 MAG: ABC transporter ATP-binding protein [Bacteroidetes bacterium RIFOXYA12_FULL_33_9]OFY89004.1 MAG: ABC transporter ATP-binding protein [Bacteroidetes bacterium RIFOXYA2_FULL_33_7]HBF89515.1 ABC transporter ATP-binding protein [Bacteroidales bacterium]
MDTFPFYKQLDTMDCGPSCLRMVFRHYGKYASLQRLRELCFINRQGVSMLGISEAAESYGMRTAGVRVNFDQLANELKHPCIVHWKQKHFIVVYKIKQNIGKLFGKSKTYVYVADPAIGKIKFTAEEFVSKWGSTSVNGNPKGICLVLEPTEQFTASESEKQKTGIFTSVLSVFRAYRKHVSQLMIALLTASLIQLIFPFLTQSIVDYGIAQVNINFITLILIAHLVFFTSRSLLDFIRNRILLHVSARVNISMLSNFLMNLMNLPSAFFESKKTGDILQRINDFKRIETFFSSTTLSILFSFVNFLIFGIVLFIYSTKIFSIFVFGSTLYALWLTIFMKQRKKLDNKRFALMSDNQSNLIQLISGIHEIKLNNCEKQKRWEWENIQAKLFKNNFASLSLYQYQQAGSTFINEVKNISITFIAALSVINGEMTLGMMIAVQYIIGQLNIPIEQMLGFFQSAQDAAISFERMNEIQTMKPEEKKNEYSADIPNDGNIEIDNLSFQYGSSESKFVLENINLKIERNKVTAIVGTSGSGKTTLIKLLLKFYDPVIGNITLGNTSLRHISHTQWRNYCGAVLQDGFIFTDTIAANIAPGEENIDKERLIDAVKVANIKDFIEGLALGFNTKIGNDGIGLSQGQKQRILIARAVYKNPEILFFDEATNALDANNEKNILTNLEDFYKGKTVVVVAHRLSTVKNADKIIVLNNGQIVEQGTHIELIEKRGNYYQLVKNQLELGN